MQFLAASSRMPRNYALLLDVVRTPGRHRHRTASEIYDAARARNPDVGFATVHRGLNRLVELGLISRLALAGRDAAYYEASVEHHAHFHCRACGTIRDLAIALPDAILATISEAADANVEANAVAFEGTCRTCRSER